MDELLLAILGAIFEAVGEFLLELIVAALADLISRMLRRSFVGFHRLGPIVSGAAFTLAGGAAGFVSVGAFPHPIFAAKGFHGLSLLVSPLAVGLGMSVLGSMVQRRGVWRTRIETFRYGFLFALAMAIVRFILVTRP